MVLEDEGIWWFEHFTGDYPTTLIICKNGPKYPI